MVFLCWSAEAADVAADILCAARVQSLSCRSFRSLRSHSATRRSLCSSVADLLPRLNQSEKVSQMGMVAAAVERLGMRQYNFGGEALHGVANCVTDRANTEAQRHRPPDLPTQFPAPVHMSHFDREMWTRWQRLVGGGAGLYHRISKALESGGFIPCALGRLSWPVVLHAKRKPRSGPRWPRRRVPGKIPL